MKTIVSFIFFSLFFSGFGKELKAYQVHYQIVSETQDSKIPKGQYIIEATIYQYNTVEKLSNVLVKSASKKKVSDSKGWFRITNKLDENYLQFSKKGYLTSYLENYKIKDQHHIKMKIYITSDEPEIYIYDREPAIAEKPIIYCYSETPIQFDFKLKPVGNLTFAYPTLNANQSWNMKLENNELTDSKTQQKYPYLFWESEQNEVNFLGENIKQYKNEIEASIVSKARIVAFLDSTLTAVGFNSQEKTDFITYWGPRMQSSNYYLIQFIQDVACESIASYEINPKPDHLNRFYMIFMENETADFPYIALPQKLKALDRNGFYMVDWGGIAINLVPFQFASNKN